MRFERGLRAGVTALAVVVLGSLAAPAQAISRDEADAIALQELAPQSEPGPVVVFGLERPVAAGRTVTEYGTGALLKRPGRAAWLYWEDLEPGARYEHASVVLLVDDANGRILLRRELGFYPLVGGKPPAGGCDASSVGKEIRVPYTAVYHFYETKP